MASVTTVLGLMAGSVAVATFAATNTFNSATSSTSIATYASAPAKANVVHVTGEDFKFDAPDVIPAGLTEIRFLNKGPALHHLAILKLAGGKTVDDLRAALANPGPPPSWVKEFGGANAPVPGEESNATLILTPGNYASFSSGNGWTPHMSGQP